MLGRKIVGRFENVLAGAGGVAERFVIKAQIKIGVKEWLAVARRVGGLRGGEDILRFRFTSEKRMHLHHRNARVTRNRDEGRAGGRQSVGSRDAKKMPDRVLDIVRIDG